MTRPNRPSHARPDRIIYTGEARTRRGYECEECGITAYPLHNYSQRRYCLECRDTCGRCNGYLGFYTTLEEGICANCSTTPLMPYPERPPIRTARTTWGASHE